LRGGAVEVHQSTSKAADDFDLRFDFALYTFAYNPISVPEIGASAGMADIRWPDYLEGWQLQRSSNLTSWATVTNVATLTNQQSVLQLPLQSQMFFRLKQGP
jgi:hypothetical protein